MSLYSCIIVVYYYILQEAACSRDYDIVPRCHIPDSIPLFPLSYDLSIEWSLLLLFYSIQILRNLRKCEKTHSNQMLIISCIDKLFTIRCKLYIVEHVIRVTTHRNYIDVSRKKRQLMF